MSPNNFEGKVALVTGGGSGIGRATCLQLAREGARVVVTDISEEAARGTLNLMASPENHLALQMDVRQQRVIEGVIATAKDKFKEPPTLLVNNAGIMIVNPIVDVTDITSEIDVNLKGTLLVTQAFLKEVLHEDKGAEEERGAVVNVASMAGKLGSQDMSVYAATKGGVIAFTKSCAAETARKGIRVNVVLPGLIDTPMSNALLAKETIESIVDVTPIGRAGRPEEVAEVIVFLLSRRSSFMAGACVEICGGLGM